MIFPKAELSKNVIHKYTTMTSDISMENSVGFFDSNRAVQDFFVGLFEILFDYKNLEELDKLHDTTSFPAVDIADDSEGVAIQVTSRNDREKISRTIETFMKYNMQTEYQRLIICILGNKSDYAPWDLGGVFTFNQEADIWDTAYIVQRIDDLSYEKLELADKYFEKYLSLISVNRLYDQDIASAIDILDRDLHLIMEKVINAYAQVKIPSRKEGFIEEKNRLNGLTWDEFKSIQGHLMHNQKVTMFLSNPVNTASQLKYLTLAGSINNFYSVNKEMFPTIDTLLRHLFKSINTYDDEIDSRKIKILLHNMYFNCDIGDNPSEA